jgi:hypothetical protein
VKSARKRILMGLLLAVPITARTQSIITNRPALTDRGHVEGLAYSNATLGFTYQLPQGFFVIHDKTPLGSFILTIADKHNGTPWRDRILLADSGQYSGTISDYVTRFIRSMPAELHVVVLRDTRRLKVAGRDFFRIDFQKTSEGKIVYQDFVCTRLKGSLVSWTFSSLNQQQVEEMAASINSVAFAPVKAQ